MHGSRLKQIQNGEVTVTKQLNDYDEGPNEVNGGSGRVADTVSLRSEKRASS